MATPELAFLTALATARLARPDIERLLVAFSGGLDSTALLAAATRTRPQHQLPVRAIHFDHAWHPASTQWAAHCVQIAAALGSVCEVERFATRPASGDSAEAWARDARYGALLARATTRSVALTAHHADDVAETFLLMALRGSGPHGLASIAPLRELGAGLLLRPWLEVPRHTLAAYVAELGLPFLEDPSNSESRYDRNFLRAQVLPILRQRWPAANRTLARAATLQWEAAQLNDRTADAELARLGATQERLPLTDFVTLSAAEQHLILRRWIVRAGVPLPDANRLQRICSEVVLAAPDRHPSVRWVGGLVRRYQQCLYLAVDTPQPLAGSVAWEPAIALHFAAGTLSAMAAQGVGLGQHKLAAHALSVRGRRGGERIQLSGKRHHQSLKQLWQGRAVPPWTRDCLPLVYAGETLAAVPGLGVATEFAAAPGEPSWVLKWQENSPLLANAPAGEQG